MPKSTDGTYTSDTQFTVLATGEVTIDEILHPRGTQICAHDKKLCHAQESCGQTGCRRMKGDIGQTIAVMLAAPPQAQVDVEEIRTKHFATLAITLDSAVDAWCEMLPEHEMVLMGPGSAARVTYPPIDRVSRLCVECHEFGSECSCPPKIQYGWYTDPTDGWREKQEWIAAFDDMRPVVEHFSTHVLIDEAKKRLAT